VHYLVDIDSISSVLFPKKVDQVTNGLLDGTLIHHSSPYIANRNRLLFLPLDLLRE
jgi:hypothetical protein